MFGHTEFKLQFRGDQEVFNEIIFLAKTKNQKKLSHLLFNSDICIDVHYKNQTPASLLAEEGDEASATFLLNNGASLKYIVQGAIRGGHTDYVTKLISDGAHQKDITNAYAQIGAIDKIENLDCSEVFDGMRICTNLSAFIPFIQTQSKSIQELIHEEEKNNHENNEDNREIALLMGIRKFYYNFTSFAAGFAFNNDVSELKEFTQEFSDIAMRGVIFSAALANHMYTISFLLSLKVNPRIGLQGACMGGHAALIKRFCQLPTYYSPDGFEKKSHHYGLRGASAGGHPTLLNELMPYSAGFSIFFFESIRSAAEGDHLSLVEQLYKRLLQLGRVFDPVTLKNKLNAPSYTTFERQLSYILKYSIMQQVIANGHLESEQNAQRFLARIPSQTFRITLASAVDQHLKEASTCEFKEEKKESKQKRLTPHLSVVARFDTQPPGLNFASHLSYETFANIFPRLSSVFIKPINCLIIQYLAPCYLTERELFTLFNTIYSQERSQLQLPLSAQRQIFGFFSPLELKQNKGVCTSWNHIIKDVEREQTTFKKDAAVEFKSLRP